MAEEDLPTLLGGLTSLRDRGDGQAMAQPLWQHLHQHFLGRIEAAQRAGQSEAEVVLKLLPALVRWLDTHRIDLTKPSSASSEASWMVWWRCDRALPQDPSLPYA